MRTMEQVIEEIRFRWKEALNFLLFKGYSEEDIKVLSRRLLTTKPESFIQENDEETFYGIVALGGFEELKIMLPVFREKYDFDDQDLANIVNSAMRSMFSLSITGWKGAEPYAVTRFKQVTNQPAERRIENFEKNDFLEEMGGYADDHEGQEPHDFDSYIKYLVTVKNYELDESYGKNGGIQGPEWGGWRSIGTVKNWFRAEKKKP